MRLRSVGGSISRYSLPTPYQHGVRVAVSINTCAAAASERGDERPSR